MKPVFNEVDQFLKDNLQNIIQGKFVNMLYIILFN
jgi:hypothetical protein